MAKLQKIFLISIIFIHGFAIAQTVKVISGQLVDFTTKKPITGATILLENQSSYHVTDDNGRFSISCNDTGNLKLTISSVGYLKQTFQISKFSNNILVLKQDVSLLDNVVITSSYGTKKRKEELVGSIATVKASELQVNQAAESFDKMLSGLVAGVQVTAGSTVGGPVKINIRGEGSLTALDNTIIGTSTQPLYILDGVVLTEEGGVDNELFDGSGNLTEFFKNPLTKISPEDIESISILKDAAAVGLYGADAANGVILITTKKSKSKKLNINFSTQTGFSSHINKIKYLSGPDYYSLYRSLLMSRGRTQEQASLEAGSSTVNTNWFELLNRDGFQQRYSLNVSKGFAKNWNLRTSINYLKNDEPQIENNFQRIGGNLNLGYSTKNFNFQLGFTPSFVNQNEPNDNFNINLRPNIAPYNPDGSFADFGVKGFGNPLAVAQQNKNQTISKGAVISINTGWSFAKYFKLNAIFGLDISNKNQDRYFSGLNGSGQYNGSFESLVDGQIASFPNNGRRLISIRDNFRWNQSTQLLYERAFKNHNFDGIIGLELQKEKVELSRELGTAFVNPNVVNPAILADRYQFNTYLSQSSRRSSFTQINYNYSKKYFALANFRRDESSVYGTDVNAALNGGFGLAWNISNEKFLKDNSWIDFLRLRTSYGVTGNSRIGSYRSQGLYAFDLNGYNNQTLARPLSAPNPNLSWERNYKFNVGLDYNIFNRFKFIIEYFVDNRTDMIVERNLPSEIGFTSIQINGADMRNSGIEFTLNTDVIKTKNFKWNFNFNISSIANIVTKVKGLGDNFSTSERARAQREGQPTSAIWGYNFAGIDPATGRELYRKDGQVYDAVTFRLLYENSNNWEIIGNSQPKFFGGFNHNFSILKNVTLGIRTNFSYGGKELINSNLESYRILEAGTISINTLDRWQQQGDNTNFGRIQFDAPVIANTTKFLYDTSRIQIQNIFLSYVVPLQKMKIKTIDVLSFDVDISNVAYFYKYKSPNNRNGIAEYRFLYPEARTVSFGTRINF